MLLFCFLFPSGFVVQQGYEVEEEGKTRVMVVLLMMMMMCIIVVWWWLSYYST